MAIEKKTNTTGCEALLKKLIKVIKPLQSVAVGFSGGVDSTVVAAAAVQALGAKNVLAVTAQSETLPTRELDDACRLAAHIGVPHAVVPTRELENASFSANPPDRCYYCKSELWRRVRVLAAERQIQYMADGVNADDMGDFRPGIKASDEAGVVHPLLMIGAGKSQVRALARSLHLPNWNKPAQACLSSRFPYGTPITQEGLRRVEQAEEFIRGMGIDELRVRVHGDIARIEVSLGILNDLSANGRRQSIVKHFKELGFRYVTLDLEGFRSGSLNVDLS